MSSQVSCRRNGFIATSCAILLWSLLAGRAGAQTGAALILKPFPKEQALESSAEGLFLNGGHTQRSNDSFQLSSYNTAGRIRIQPGELTSPRIGFDFSFLDLDTSNSALPRQLVDQSIAIARPIGKFGDWIVGLSIGVGYAGPTPFGDGNAWYGKSTLAVFRELSDTSAIVFGLDYDRNRTFLPDIPLPGVAYTRRIDPTLLVVVGLPLTSLEWKPDDRLRVELSYYPLDEFEATVGYRLIDHLELFGSIQRYRHGFFIDGLNDNKDRLLFEQRRAEVGLSWQPRDQFRLSVAGGYAWGGEFSTGFDQRETRLVADISDEPYVRAALEMRF